MIPNYRKRIECVQATQLTREMIDAAVLDGAPLPAGVFIGGAHFHRGDRKVWRADVWVDVGIHKERAEVGDWVTVGVDGCVVRWPADIFQRVFEPLTTSEALST